MWNGSFNGTDNFVRRGERNQLNGNWISRDDRVRTEDRHLYALSQPIRIACIIGWAPKRRDVTENDGLRNLAPRYARQDVHFDAALHIASAAGKVLALSVELDDAGLRDLHGFMCDEARRHLAAFESEKA